MLPHEFADMIKKLPEMDTWDRRELEDKTDIGALPSGFISYAKDPISEAIQIYTDFANQWEESLKWRPRVKPEAKIKQIVWWARAVVSNLKNESRS